MYHYDSSKLPVPPRRPDGWAPLIPVLSCMNKASVSVVIPCYQCENTIRRAVDSVVNQTVRPQELILVDDGSADQTPTVLKHLQTLYGESWIKIVSLRRNGGVSAARNVGWDLATSDYVAFLDADDIWHPEKIAIQYQWMRAHPEVALCGHGSVVMDPKVQPVTASIRCPPTVHLLSVRRLLLSNPFVTPSFLLKRTLPHRFDCTQRYTEDFLLIMQIGLDGNQVAKIEAELAFIFKRPGETGASRHIWKMRAGDLLNYHKLWHSRRLCFAGMCVLSLYSIIKFAVMLTVGARLHTALKSWCGNRYRNG